MIPAVFTVGEAVAHEAKDVTFRKRNGKTSVDCEIRGVHFRGIETPSENEKYAFVLRNKTTGKLRVVARQPLLFRPHKEDEHAATTSTKPLERNALAEAFGSGRRVKAIRERQERESAAGSARKVEAVVSAVTKEAMKDSPARAPNTASVLPPILNLEATQPSQVFDLKSLLPSDVHQGLQEDAATLAESSPEQRLKWQQEGTYSAVVISRLAFLPAEPEPKMQCATRLALLQKMLNLHKMPAASLRSHSALSDLPAPVAQHLLRNFTLIVETPTRRVRCCPTWIKEKLVYHILLLILHLDCYKTDMPELVSHFKMSSVRLAKFFQGLGCKVETDRATDRKYAILRTPVKFMEPKLKP